MSEYESLVLHLKRCGFVDPDDDTVPFWKKGDEAPFVWVPASYLAAAILGWVDERDREANDE